MHWNTKGMIASTSPTHPPAVLALQPREHVPELGSLTNPLSYFKSALPPSLTARLAPLASAHAIARALRDHAQCLIVGGSVLNKFGFERDFEFWRHAPAPIVFWGGGIDARDHQSHGVTPQLEDYHQLRAFSLIGLRDDGFGFPWVPCPSCMHPVLDRAPEWPTGTGTVIILHHALRKAPEIVAPIALQDPDARVVFSDEPFSHQIQAIREADVVVTNDYHAAYWATLAARRVVAIGDGGRTRRLRHKIATAKPDNWRVATDKAKRHVGALDECRQANVDFHERVTRLIGKTGIAKKYARDPIAERLVGDHAASPALQKYVVPKIVHFVFGLNADFGGKPFNIMHRIAVLSAIDRLKPEQTFLHYRYLPEGDDFAAVRSLLTLEQLSPPPNTRMHFAHMADIVRLRTLEGQGGIYLDLDTITVSSFDHLLVHPFAIGLQGRQPVDGLCNAVMLAAPRNPFIRDWLGAYERFTSEWDKFSVRLPFVMWKSGKWQAHVEPHDSFHWPLWNRSGLAAMFERNVPFPNALCHHLWESFSHPRYFAGKTPEEARHELRSETSTYARLARPYL